MLNLFGRGFCLGKKILCLLLASSIFRDPIDYSSRDNRTNRTNWHQSFYLNKDTKYLLDIFILVFGHKEVKWGYNEQRFSVLYFWNMNCDRQQDVAGWLKEFFNELVPLNNTAYTSFRSVKKFRGHNRKSLEKVNFVFKKVLSFFTNCLAALTDSKFKPKLSFWHLPLSLPLSRSRISLQPKDFRAGKKQAFKGKSSRCVGVAFLMVMNCWCLMWRELYPHVCYQLSGCYTGTEGFSSRKIFFWKEENDKLPVQGVVFLIPCVNWSQKGRKTAVTLEIWQGLFCLFSWKFTAWPTQKTCVTQRQNWLHMAQKFKNRQIIGIVVEKVGTLLAIVKWPELWQPTWQLMSYTILD